VGISRDCPNFLSTPIISGTGKVTNFNFCTHIPSIDRNKSPLQISGKVAGCVMRTLKTFQGTHILGTSRGLLCDSYAVLFYRAKHYCSKSGLAIACRPSVRPSVSVTLMDQDRIGWKSWKLIALTISCAPSLFVAQRLST